MENNNLVRVKLYSDRKHFKVIEVREDEVEKVREANRMTWRELDKEIRRRKRLEKDGILVLSLESIDDDDAWISDESPNAEDKIINEETRLENIQLLKTAISKLEPRQQEMIKLVFFEGKTQDEVASLYGITKAAVSNSMQRTYAALKKYLQNN